MLFNWMLCGILTAAGALPEDPKDQMYDTRTDARVDVLSDSPWFSIPYPGKP